MNEHLTETDYAVLHAIGVARYLTARHLDWLFTAHRTRARDERRAQYPHRAIYERLARLSEGGYTRALTHERERVYLLRRAGAKALGAAWGEDVLAQLTVTEGAFTLDKLSHAVAIGACYAALRAAVERLIHQGAEGFSLNAWEIDARIEPRDGVIPDARFRLNGMPYLLEVDRGGRNLGTWDPKAAVYGRWLRADPRLHLLVVAPSHTRLGNIAAIIADETDTPERVRYALDEAITPETIRTDWYALNERGRLGKVDLYHEGTHEDTHEGHNAT